MFSFAKEFSAQTITNVENDFITKYMLNADGDAVKVYLYGLFLCSHTKLDLSFDEFCNNLSLPNDKVLDCLSYWEDYGILSLISKEPFTVEYMPVKGISKSVPRKIKAEKYTEFTKSIQALFPNKMISVGEYTEYFNIMETYPISPEALIMITKYCIDIKGNTIGYRYILTVAKDFCNRGITSIEKIENELSTYVSHSEEIVKVLKAISIHRRPEIEDLNYYNRWLTELCFEPEIILYTAKISKKNNIKKLDNYLSELFSMKCFTKQEIDDYNNKKQNIFDLTLKINRALSIYVEVLETEIESYINNWLSYGFSDQTLIFIATTCFKDGKNNLVDMNDRIDSLRKLGYIDLSSVNDYFEEINKQDEFIKNILLTCGLNRRPTSWDRENLNIWRSWNFTDEMILEASKISSGKSSPIAYINGILSNWKNKGIFDKDQIEEKITDKINTDSQEEYNREYEKRRALAILRAQKNTERAFELQGFSAIYQRLNGIEKDMAFAEISNNKEREKQLETEKSNLLHKANEILSKINISFDDLSPKYACQKCNDTGYIGTKRCDCYKK